MAWCRSVGVRRVTKLLERKTDCVYASSVRLAHPAFTDEEFTLRKKAMARFRSENEDWLKKKIKTAIPQLDLGIVTTKSDGLPEYSDEPEYPPIFDASKEGLKKYKRDQWIQKLREFPTVEEKAYWMNERKYYGFRTFLMLEHEEPYGSMDFLRFVTRTQFVPEAPSYYGELDDAVEKALPRVKDTLLTKLKLWKATECLGISEDPLEAKAKEYDEGIQIVVDALLMELGDDYEHLRDVAVDYKPRVEAHWFCGGFYPHRILRLSREGLYAKTDMAHKVMEKVSYPFQIFCDIGAQVRSEQPLPEIVNFDDPLVVDSEEKAFDWPYHPQSLYLPWKLRHGTNIPGFWPSDHNEFGLVSFAPRTFIDRNVTKITFDGLYDIQDALDQRGIKNGFAWTFGQATYQGFECYNDITYPLVSQNVITDGQHFSFYTYQLNTTKLHDEFATANPKWNICWGLPEMKLYDGIDESGNFTGVNDDVIRWLIRFMIKQPRERVGLEMKPYLSAEKHVHNLTDECYRNYIAENYKYLASNRPRMIERPQIYAWEKIYKIDFNTRPLDARKRFFALKRNPNVSIEERLKNAFTS